MFRAVAMITQPRSKVRQPTVIYQQKRSQQTDKAPLKYNGKGYVTSITIPFCAYFTMGKKTLLQSIVGTSLDSTAKTWVPQK